jgi:hypothetical protein
MAFAERPRVLAIVFCETIERGSDSISLIRTLGRLTAKVFPAAFESVGFYVILTDGNGNGMIEIEMSDVDDNETTTLVEDKIAFSNPKHAIEMGFVIQDMHFREPAEYLVRVLADGEVIGQRSLYVMSRD